jgi:hypothetical protein
LEIAAKQHQLKRKVITWGLVFAVVVALFAAITTRQTTYGRSLIFDIHSVSSFTIIFSASYRLFSLRNKYNPSNSRE